MSPKLIKKGPSLFPIKVVCVHCGATYEVVDATEEFLNPLLIKSRKPCPRVRCPKCDRPTCLPSKYTSLINVEKSIKEKEFGMAVL